MQIRFGGQPIRNLVPGTRSEAEIDSEDMNSDSFISFSEFLQNSSQLWKPAKRARTLSVLIDTVL